MSGRVSIVRPTHLHPALRSLYATASSTVALFRCPDSASCSAHTKRSRYASGIDMNVPPIRISSTLSVLCPSRRSWSSRARVCAYGSYRARIARIDVGSYPV